MSSAAVVVPVTRKGQARQGAGTERIPFGNASDQRNVTKLYKRKGSTHPAIMSNGTPLARYPPDVMREALSGTRWASAKALTKSHVCSVFDKYDTEQRGRIEHRQALEAMTELGLPRTKESLRSLTSIFGLDLTREGIDKRSFLQYFYTVTAQRRFRDRRATAVRLHCRNLSERLLLENHIVHGTFRLLNQLMVFSFLLVAISFGSDPSIKRGVYNELADAFSFQEIRQTKLRGHIYDDLKLLSDTSKDYMLLSNRYFDSGEHGPVTLLGPLRSFATSQVLGGVDLSIEVSHFSFSAWVRSTPQFVRGFIVQKRLVSAGDGEDLSCWGWRLDKTSGPALSFGVHDMFPTTADLSEDSSRELDVGLSEPEGSERRAGDRAAFPPNEFHLLTIIVNATHVSFHRDNTHLGTSAMPRPLTDCFNNFEGLLLGSAGLTLGQVRFYPFALTPAGIEEILVFGSSLEEISSGSSPLYAQETVLDATRRSLGTTLSSVDASLADRQYALEISQVVQAVDEQPAEDYAAPFMAAGGTTAESWDAAAAAHTLSHDQAGGPGFHLLLRGPHHLGRLQDDEQRYLTKVPSFEGTGCTFTFWYRHVDCKSTSCGGYVLFAGDFLYWHGDPDPDPSIYWSIWVEDEGIWLDSPGKGYYWFDDTPVTRKYRPNGNRIWRHMALRFDEVRNEVAFYLDGVLAVVESQPDKPVREIDQPTPGGYDTAILLGHADPGYSEAIQCDLADLRMYPHTQGVLGAEAIKAIASAAHQVVAPRCVASVALRDEVWKDSLGHDCLWFLKARMVQPSVCQLREAAAQCPISCRSQQECYAPRETITPRFVFDSIQRIEASSPNGTFCLGRHGKGYPAAAAAEKASMLEACRRLASEGGDQEVLAAWLDSMVDADTRESTGREGRRLNLTNCEELVCAPLRCRRVAVCRWQGI
jgi:hypothetical protein